MKISSRAIQFPELNQLIDFDRVHLQEVMKQIGIPEERCAPQLTHTELAKAYQRKDILRWILVNEEVAGYFWREKQTHCLFGTGAAIKAEYYGRGLFQYLIDYTEAKAREENLSFCQLAVIPENGRVISAYMKRGYQIIKSIPAYWGPQFPKTFRCIMEKNLNSDLDPSPLAALASGTTAIRCEIHCKDDEEIKALTEQGYRGVALIRPDNLSQGEHRFIFEKHDS